MSALPLPYGGAEILALRQSGRRPADMVLVSLIGPLRELNPVVMAKPERAYDWRFLARLSILIVGTTKTEHLPGIVKSIEAADPATLCVWFADQQDGLNVMVDGWKPRSKEGRRMELAQRTRYAGLGSVVSSDDCRQQIAEQARRRAMENAGRFDSALVAFAQQGFRQLFGAAWEAA